METFLALLIIAAVAGIVTCLAVTFKLLELIADQVKEWLK